MVKEGAGQCVRRVLAVVAIAMSIVWSHAIQASIVAFEIRGDVNVARLLLELPAGTFIDAQVTGLGDVLELRLKGVDRRELSERIVQFAGRHPLYKGTRVLPGEGEVTRVMIEFTRPLAVIDETIVALPDKMSRWEIVLGPAELAAPPGIGEPAPAPFIVASTFAPGTAGGASISGGTPGEPFPVDAPVTISTQPGRFFEAPLSEIVRDAAIESAELFSGGPLPASLFLNTLKPGLSGFMPADTAVVVIRVRLKDKDGKPGREIVLFVKSGA